MKRAIDIFGAIVALILFILMYILYFRFSPKNEYGVLLTPICFGLNIPFVMPVGMGLLRELYSMFSLVCGIRRPSCRWVPIRNSIWS